MTASTLVHVFDYRDTRYPQHLVPLEEALAMIHPDAPTYWDLVAPQILVPPMRVGLWTIGAENNSAYGVFVHTPHSAVENRGWVDRKFIGYYEVWEFRTDLRWHRTTR